jgi:uncharacterized ion transporter superfamily protein YfcC
MESSKNIPNVANDIVKTVSQMKDVEFVVLCTVITLIIILIAILAYFYYTGKRSKNCKNMDTIYGDLNGKIKSIDSSDQFNYTFKDYYIKTAYNCCSGGNYKND